MSLLIFSKFPAKTIDCQDPYGQHYIIRLKPDWLRTVISLLEKYIKLVFVESIHDIQWGIIK